MLSSSHGNTPDISYVRLCMGTPTLDFCQKIHEVKLFFHAEMPHSVIKIYYFYSSSGDLLPTFSVDSDVAVLSCPQVTVI